MSLRYQDWVAANDGAGDDGQTVWNACLNECAQMCRAFGEKMSEEPNNAYAVLRYQRKFGELASKIEQAQLEQ